MFDDSFEDRGDFGGFARGSKAVFGVLVASQEVRRVCSTTVSRMVAMLVASQEDFGGFARGS